MKKIQLSSNGGRTWFTMKEGVRFLIPTAEDSLLLNVTHEGIILDIGEKTMSLDWSQLAEMCV